MVERKNVWEKWCVSVEDWWNGEAIHRSMLKFYDSQSTWEHFAIPKVDSWKEKERKKSSTTWKNSRRKVSEKKVGNRKKKKRRKKIESWVKAKKKVKEKKVGVRRKSAKMPSSPVTQHHDHIDESDNDDFSNANENSNLSEINPHVLSTPATLLRQAAAQMSAATTNFNQNSSSSSSSSYVNNANSAGSNSHGIANTNQTSSRDSSASRKFRHQNFSKNIYIGTKNAERWDNLRNLFQFKNDVEFVSFLLTVAENEARRKENGWVK